MRGELTVRFRAERRMKRNMRSPVRLRGFTRTHLAGLLRELRSRSGAEIGVKAGRYTAQLAEAVQWGGRILAVDPYFDYGDDEVRITPAMAADRLATAYAVVAKYQDRVQFVRQLSHVAVRDVTDGSLDFVYIDGNHTFDYVIRDLIEWSRRVRVGGIVAGHDYLHWKRGGVVAAVDAYTAAHGITEWFLTDEEYPTFFWMKE